MNKVCILSSLTLLQFLTIYYTFIFFKAAIENDVSIDKWHNYHVNEDALRPCDRLDL